MKLAPAERLLQDLGVTEPTESTLKRSPMIPGRKSDTSVSKAARPGLSVAKISRSSRSTAPAREGARDSRSRMNSVTGNIIEVDA
jgi:hypothetical protein